MNSRIRTLIIGLIAASSFATAAIAPAVSQAVPAAPVTCEGGAKPGGTMVKQFTINGTVVKEKKYICGSDGQWHEVVAREEAKISTPPSTPRVPVVVTPLRAVG